VIIFLCVFLAIFFYYVYKGYKSDTSPQRSDVAVQNKEALSGDVKARTSSRNKIWTVGVKVGVVVFVVALMAAISLPDFFPYYQMKTYNAAALTDLRNAKTSCYAFYAAHKRYPQTLHEAGFQSANGVQVTYERIDDKNFIILSQHASGAKIYKITSTSSRIDWRYMNAADSPFTPLRE